MKARDKIFRDREGNVFFLYAEDGDFRPAVLNHIEDFCGADIRNFVEEQFARFDEAVEEIAELEAELSRLAELKDVLFESNISLTSSARALEASIREAKKNAKALRRANATLEAANSELRAECKAMRETCDTMCRSVGLFSEAWQLFVVNETATILPTEGDNAK